MVVAGQRIVPVRPSDWALPHRLWPVGDIHFGARGCDKERLRTTVRTIAADPHARWVGMGDYFDMIWVGDKRFDPTDLDPGTEPADLGDGGNKCLDTGMEEFSPIRDKCLGLMQGNHEKKGGQFVSIVVKALCNKRHLAVPFLGYCCMFDLVFYRTGKRPLQHGLRVAAHHGAGAAQTPGGKLNRVKRFSTNFDADIYLYGHIHARLDDESVELGADDDCRKLVEQSKRVVSTGTYLRTYQHSEDGASGYGEEKQYEPTPLGSPCIEIVPATGEVSVSKPSNPLHWRFVRAEAISARQA